jgi:hypothetical protein
VTPAAHQPPPADQRLHLSRGPPHPTISSSTTGEDAPIRADQRLHPSRGRVGRSSHSNL